MKKPVVRITRRFIEEADEDPKPSPSSSSVLDELAMFTILGLAVWFITWLWMSR